MLDSFVIFLSYLSILCYLKFYHLRHKYENLHTQTLDLMNVCSVKPSDLQYISGLYARTVSGSRDVILCPTVAGRSLESGIAD